MEKCNIVYVASMKCEESSHYSRNCLLCHAAGCCAVPIASTKRQELVKMGQRVDFYSTQSTAMQAKNIVLHNIKQYFTCKRTLPYVMHLIH
jgi:hypothetical protein